LGIFHGRILQVNPFPRTWIEIDLPSLKWNLDLIRQRIGPAPKIALVAKADAYGHGIVPISRFAARNGADWIAVATVQEGIALRDAGLQCPILVLSPILEVEAEQAVFYDLRVMLETVELADALQSAAVAQSRTALVHLPVDTGVSRFGLTPEQVPGMLEVIRSRPGLQLEGMGTHFADSGGNDSRTREQLEAFHSLLSSLGSQSEGWVLHAANSAAATLYDNDATFDLVRVGIAAYGVDPYGMFSGALRPLLTWKARVMSLRTRPAGTLVSYSGTYRCDRDTVIATLGVGYGDGYPRSLSNTGFVQIQGKPAPVVGLVCMDQVLVDVTEIPGVVVGEEAILIGEGVTVVELARRGETNVHEIITRIMSRVPRRYRYE